MKDWDIKTIVLGYDGSEGAERASELAYALARQNKARIVVATAYHVFARHVAPDKTGDAILEAERTAQDLVLKLQAAGVEVEPDVLEGPAGEALVRIAEARDADMIVVGRRGRGRAVSLLLGSTAEYVVRRATVPVLVAH